MDAETRRLVRERASYRCEYCGLPQSAAHFVTFQIEHIVAKQHRVDDGLGNLALACPDCNRRKGPNLTTLDRKTGDVIRLFNPRSDDWSEHFEVADGVIIGLTAIGPRLFDYWT